MASEVTDFPDPDSPTRPSTSPGAMAKLKSPTAFVGRPWVENSTVR